MDRIGFKKMMIALCGLAAIYSLYRGGLVTLALIVIIVLIVLKGGKKWKDRKLQK